MRDPEDGLTHQAEASPWRRAGDEIARVTSSVGLERSARLVAVALVPVFLVSDTIARFVPIYTALIIYVLVTSFAPRNRFLRAADLVVGAALIVATGGAVLPFVLFLMVAVAGPAARGGLLAGFAAGGTLSIVLLTTLGALQRLDDLEVSELIPAGLLLPLVGVTIGAAAQVYAAEEAQDRRKLQEANRLLSALRAIADDLPGGLDTTTVAAALVAEVRSLQGTKAALVYALDEGLLKPVAASGTSPGALPVLRVDRLRALGRPGRARLESLSTLPTELQAACDAHRWWSIAGMYRDEDLVGMLLVGVDDPDAARASRPHLVALATDGALALQNAQLFDGTRERAAQAARRHLAGDLHDGAAQALAHLRMELELLAMADEDRDGGELGRLAGVARTALEDLRATITGLRREGDDDVAEAIRRHIDFLSKQHGPRLEFVHTGDTHVSAIVGDELLRVVQEALSNALRHAGAQRIRVTLEADTELLRLEIEDDGLGLGAPSARRGGGIGIRSMQERATRLGGRIDFGVAEGGGTVIALRCPAPGRGTDRRPAPGPSLDGAAVEADHAPRGTGARPPDDASWSRS